MGLTLETALRNVIADAVVDLLNSGTIDITTSGDVVLATVTFGNPAFGDAAIGVATANAITKDSDCDAAGTAAKMKVKNSGGTLQFTGTVTVTGGGGDCQLNTVSIVQHAELSISSMTVTCPAS